MRDFRFLARRFLALTMWFLRITGSSFSTRIGLLTVCIVKLRLSVTVSNYSEGSFAVVSAKFKAV